MDEKVFWMDEKDLCMDEKVFLDGCEASLKEGLLDG